MPVAVLATVSEFMKHDGRSTQGISVPYGNADLNCLYRNAASGENPHHFYFNYNAQTNKYSEGWTYETKDKMLYELASGKLFEKAALNLDLYKYKPDEKLTGKVDKLIKYPAENRAMFELDWEGWKDCMVDAKVLPYGEVEFSVKYQPGVLKPVLTEDVAGVKLNKIKVGSVQAMTQYLALLKQRLSPEREQAYTAESDQQLAALLTVGESGFYQEDVKPKRTLVNAREKSVLLDYDWVSKDREGGKSELIKLVSIPNTNSFRIELLRSGVVLADNVAFPSLSSELREIKSNLELKKENQAELGEKKLGEKNFVVGEGVKVSSVRGSLVELEGQDGLKMKVNLSNQADLNALKESGLVNNFVGGGVEGILPLERNDDSASLSADRFKKNLESIADGGKIFIDVDKLSYSPGISEKPFNYPVKLFYKGAPYTVMLSIFKPKNDKSDLKFGKQVYLGHGELKDFMIDNAEIKDSSVPTPESLGRIISDYSNKLSSKSLTYETKQILSDLKILELKAKLSIHPTNKDNNSTEQRVNVIHEGKMKTLVVSKGTDGKTTHKFLTGFNSYEN